MNATTPRTIADLAITFNAGYTNATGTIKQLTDGGVKHLPWDHRMARVVFTVQGSSMGDPANKRWYGFELGVRHHSTVLTERAIRENAGVIRSLTSRVKVPSEPGVQYTTPQMVLRMMDAIAACRTDHAKLGGKIYDLRNPAEATELALDLAEAMAEALARTTA